MYEAEIAKLKAALEEQSTKREKDTAEAKTREVIAKKSKPNIEEKKMAISSEASSVKGAKTPVSMNPVTKLTEKSST